MTTIVTQEIFVEQVGDPLPLVLEPWDGNTGVYPQVVLQDNLGSVITTVNLPLVGNAYEDYTHFMPNFPYIIGVFTVYSDSGHTTPDTAYSRAVVQFTISPAASKAVTTNPSWLGSPSLLQRSSGTAPWVAGAMLDWLQPMTFTTTVKTVVNFLDVETPTSISFLGIWQPYSSQKLLLRPEGQRSWSWFTVHASTDLVLKPDQVITYKTVQYRVMEKLDWTEYGYVEYHLIADYSGSGPT